jgi:RimJ/RimL family protein N-acetyltransferase
VLLRPLAECDIPPWFSRATDAEAAELAGAAYAFNALGIRELQAEVLRRNFASVRLLEKLGFHVSRTVSAQEAADGEACFHYTLRAHAGTAA